MKLHINYMETIDNIYHQFYNENTIYWTESLQECCRNIWRRWRPDAVFKDAYFQAWVPVTQRAEFQPIIKFGMYGGIEWKDSSSERESPTSSDDDAVEAIQQLSLASNGQP